MVKMTDEIRAAYRLSLGVHETVDALAPLIIAQYEAEKAASAAPVPFEITSMDQKVQFRDGTPARLLAVDLPGKKPIIALHSNGLCYRMKASGFVECVDGRFDLIPIPPTERAAYVNVYPDLACGLYPNRAHADRVCVGGRKRIGCNRIVLKEGVWDE